MCVGERARVKERRRKGGCMDGMYVGQKGKGVSIIGVEVAAAAVAAAAADKGHGNSGHEQAHANVERKHKGKNIQPVECANLKQCCSFFLSFFISPVVLCVPRSWRVVGGGPCLKNWASVTERALHRRIDGARQLPWKALCLLIDAFGDRIPTVRIDCRLNWLGGLLRGSIVGSFYRPNSEALASGGR